MTQKRVLIVFYSFTQQTRLLVKNFAEGLEGKGVEVVQERLEPLHSYRFPFKSNSSLTVAMVETFFRKRSGLQPLNPVCFDSFDCFILAGPTWSYQPSGPVFSFLDRYGSKLCKGQLVIPLISCRSYWRIHYLVLRRSLRAYGATVGEPVVFLHPMKEPWRFIGLVLQLLGKMPRKDKSWFRKHYPGYGHSREQLEDALKEGRHLAEKLLGKSSDHSA